MDTSYFRYKEHGTIYRAHHATKAGAMRDSLQDYFVYYKVMGPDGRCEPDITRPFIRTQLDFYQKFEMLGQDEIELFGLGEPYPRVRITTDCLIPLEEPLNGVEKPTPISKSRRTKK